VERQSPYAGRERPDLEARVTLFDEADSVAPAGRPPMTRGMRAGIWALVVALVALLGLSFLPTGYVVQQPGPVYDTIGEVTNADGEEVPLISIPGAETFATDGSLDLLTVQVVGSPERPVSWLEILAAWFDRTRAVVPIETVYPSGLTTGQRDEQNAALMTDSQLEAEAAAFTHLGHDVAAAVEVASVAEDGAAAGQVEPGDVIASVDGQPVASTEQLRADVAAAAGASVTLGIQRGGQAQDVVVTPTRGDDGTWLLGITVQETYDLPYDVSFGLTSVGGPSAGMMFALGMIDLLTPGELTGGADVAGTGTITVDGTVGPIGGIRQKLWGAADAGADYFLAPEANCDQVVGHVPDGLRVFAVSTLDDSLAVLDALAGDGDLDAFPTCTTG
jgi:PDZ domain-containing protein